MSAAWHPDPTGRHELRYWDGTQWTDHVSDQGHQSQSPLYPAAEQPVDTGADWVGSDAAESTEQSGPTTDGSTSGDGASAAESAEGGPLDESAVEPERAVNPLFGDATVVAGAGAAEPSQAAQPTGQQPMGQPPSQPPMGQPYGQQMGGQPMGGQPYGDAFGGITGELIDGRFSEISGAGAILQNKRLLRVRITEPFMATQGSMVAYQGNVNFNYQGSGAAKFLKKAFTGEGLSLMRVEGQGDVFLADLAREVHILHLNNSGLSVSSKNVLAFSAALEWNVERVKGGSMAAGGLFNTTLRGTGWVAITTDGDPVVLNAGEAPTFADANALVAWSVNLQTSIRSTMSAGALIGRGSGEAFQVSFQGPGFVIVQPSEGLHISPTT